MFIVTARDVVIDAPIDVVFSHYDDGRLYRQWMSRVTEAEMLTPEPITTGTRFAPSSRDSAR